MPGLSTILLADGNADDVLLIRNALSQAGAQQPVLVVASAGEVIEYLSGQGNYCDRQTWPFPSLLLLDVQLPGDGFRVLEWIGAHSDIQRRVRPLVLTGLDLTQPKVRARELGAEAYFVKPSRFQDLVEIAKQIKKDWLATGADSL